MDVYYIFLFVLFFISFLDVVKIPHKRSIFIVTLFLLCIFYGGRTGCDNDYWNYVRLFKSAPTLIGSSVTDLLSDYSELQVEPGFMFTCSLLKTIGLPYQSIFFFCAFLTFYFVGKSIWEVSNFPFLSLFIFNAQFFEQPFMQIRFGMAFALVFYAGRCLYVGKIKRYFLYLLLACSFHSLGIIGLALFFGYKLRLNIAQITLCLLLSICLLFVPLSGVLQNILDYLGFDRYGFYFSEEDARTVTVFLLIVILLPFIHYRHLIIRHTKYYNYILLLALCSIIFCPLKNELPILARFYILYSVAYCMIIPCYLYIMKRSVSGYILFYLFLLGYALQKFSASLSYVTPYQFCL